MSYDRVLCLLVVLCCADVTLAETITALEHRHTERVPTSEAGSSWGLTRSEWQRYEQIMSARRGTWSPGLDPITALGVSAETAAARDRFAELYVRTEFERTRKELAFQWAVDRAWARLYPDTPRLQSRALTGASRQPTVRYALVVSTECPACDSTLASHLTGMIEQAKEGVDVHVVGTGGDDSALRQWVSLHPDVLQAVQQGQVTVNHGHAFSSMPVFPAIYAKTENGQWSRER